jgi:signal transduction histidine kinase/AraC-like DNA-binding protein
MALGASLQAQKGRLLDALLASRVRCLASVSLEAVRALVDDFISDTVSPPEIPASSRFLSALQQLLVKLVRAGVDPSCVQDALSQLRRAVAEALMMTLDAPPARSELAQPAAGSTHPAWTAIEERLGQARVMVCDIARRAAHAGRMRTARRMATLRHLGHTLTTVVDLEQLGMTLAEELPKIGISDCYLVLFEDSDNPTGWASLHFAYRNDRPLDLPPEGMRFRTQHLLPAPFWADIIAGTAGTYVVEPLYIRDQQFGFILVKAGPRELLFEDQPDSGSVYDLLRGYVSDALYGILLYEDALRARQQAEEADRLKSRFLSMVSHELRTPLNLIVSLSEMLLWQQGGYQQELSRIHASAQHLDGLIRDVLDLAGSQVGQLQLVREPLDLRQALDVVTLIGEQMAQDKGLSWVAEMPEALPRVWADRTRIRQVALNLVSNALRFTSIGEVRLTITQGEGIVTVAVSDTGIGVPPEEQEIIFDEFQQSERTAARGYGGLGLGLAISRRLVEMHGGMIGVRSSGKEGEGAVFFFTLPVMDGVDGASLGQAGHPELTSEFAKRTVILLSAQRDAGQSLRDYLAVRGYAVKTLAYSHDRSPDDPNHWLNQILLTVPGAVILDAEPAKEHGWTLMRLLKENPKTRNTPVLFYSLLQEEQSGSMLALDYLSKPVSMDDIVNVLDRQGLMSGEKTSRCAGRSCADPANDEVCSSFTFLVVDDNPNVVATHTWLLQSQLPTSRVLQANNGRQALDVMKRTHPDLVLLDLMMPELNGFEVLTGMQQDPDLCDIPVVVLTAKSLTDEAVSRLTKGVTAVLGKGLFSAEETLSRVEAALRVDRGSPRETREIVRQAMVYLHEHYAEPLTRQDVADHVNLSARHLDRCFCEQTGITPMTYLNRFRLRQARRLLQNSALNIGDIALAVGFADSAYFSRVFRKDTGMSPTDYRRMHG